MPVLIGEEDVVGRGKGNKAEKEEVIQDGVLPSLSTPSQENIAR